MKKNSNTNQEKESFFSSVISFIILFSVVLGFKSTILDANNIPTGSMIPTLKIGDFLFVNKMRYSLRLPFAETEIFRIDDPKRGDIVTFIPPAEALRGESGFSLFPKRFVKRVVGLPGDTIRIRKKVIPSRYNRGDIIFSTIEYKASGTDEFKTFEPREIPIAEVLSDLDNVDASSRALYLEKKQDFEHYVIDGFEYTREGLFEGGKESETVYQIPENHYMMVGDNRDDSYDSREWGYIPRENILGKALVIYFSINWKDHSCIFKDESELAHKGAEDAQIYSGAELEKRCSDVYNTRFSENMPLDVHHSSIQSGEMSWLQKTMFYRLFRMEVRWKRIGKILE